MRKRAVKPQLSQAIRSKGRPTQRGAAGFGRTALTQLASLTLRGLRFLTMPRGEIPRKKPVAPSVISKQRKYDIQKWTTVVSTMLSVTELG
jgi:hypothetical protein